MLQSKKEKSEPSSQALTEIPSDPPYYDPYEEAEQEYAGDIRFENDTVHDKPLPPVSELKAAVIKALREDRHSLAAAMEKSEIWTIMGNTLNLTFNSPFESTFIEKECREIEGIIQKSLGWDIRINTIIKEKNEVSQVEKQDEQVELVQNVFRGTIINRS